MFYWASAFLHANKSKLIKFIILIKALIENLEFSTESKIHF